MTDTLRMLIVHEAYVRRGGEEVTIESDTAILSTHGHSVSHWSVSNAEISDWTLIRKGSLLWKTTWSSNSYHVMRQLIDRHQPDVVHFHNTLPIISPAAIRAAHNAGRPVVMTLHNYRLMCPVATLYRDGRICEECHDHSLARGVIHRCYRGSSVQTAAVSMMIAAHRRLGTWSECVDAYIALTEFMRSKVVQGGLPAERVHVRGTAVEIGPALVDSPDSYALFVGRLSEEKGISCLIDAARRLDGISLKVIGTGPMEALVRAVGQDTRLSFEVLGQRTHEETIRLISRARVLVFPSVWYEGLPVTILEAFACGVPVVASRLGSMAEIVTDEHDGFLFTPGDAQALADRVRRLISDDALWARMSRAARATHEARYSTKRCYERLMEIYRIAIESAAARRKAA